MLTTTADSTPLVRPAPERPLRRELVHLARCLLLAAIVAMIHFNAAERRDRAVRSASQPPDLAEVRAVIPNAASLAPSGSDQFSVLDDRGQTLGQVLQTSPQADHIVGFSGPTNLLVALDDQQRICGVVVLSSRDTAEHIEQVTRDEQFLSSFRGLSAEELTQRGRVDTVSGATLTSLAIIESIDTRLRGRREASLKFPNPPDLELVRTLFPSAARLADQPDELGLLRVDDGDGRPLGFVLRTTPAVDQVIGYQGPTEALVGLVSPADSDTPTLPGESAAVDSAELVVARLAIGPSFDNEPYVGYVREDEYFLTLFDGRTLGQLAELDLREAGVEGVSGATMTSMAIAEGLPLAARQPLERQRQSRADMAAARWTIDARAISTIAITTIGLLIGLTRLRGISAIRTPYLLAVVGYLGFVNGDLLSQALWTGWAQNGVPWRNMLGPLVLSVAAILLPMVVGRNIYCSHICPHGAVQQLLLRRFSHRFRLGPRMHRALSLIPLLLLIWVTVVAVGGLGFSLVDIEPFDAYVPAIAGYAALAIFVVGITASLFIPMAYCHYGCPTGALLNFIRRHSRSDRLSARDAVAVVCLLVAIAMTWQGRGL
ncbi:MAG: 4Fe-4S binding protein [Planctomycetaceae bacterium]